MSERIRDLRDMVRSNPAVSIDDARFRSLAEVQSVFWRRKDELARKLESGAITPDEYRDGFNQALAESMTASKRILGRQDFRALFGEAGEHPDQLIDPDIFEDVHRPRPGLQPF
ncbi:hypothetical protein J2X36_003011 [Methylobacterium sp. BE186]|nr:hypothetical protein [Methylobacterium sp. BE186]MDR7038252.1 hypothetical protein [Methylobacterium sp. BE186]